MNSKTRSLVAANELSSIPEVRSPGYTQKPMSQLAKNLKAIWHSENSDTYQARITS